MKLMYNYEISDADICMMYDVKVVGSRKLHAIGAFKACLK